MKALLKGATAEIVSSQAVAAAKTAVTLEVRERQEMYMYRREGGRKRERGEREMGGDGGERVNA